MSAYGDMFQAVLDMAQISGLYAQIAVGALPAANGLCMAPATGAPQETYWNKSGAHELSVVVNGKHSDQQTVLNALANIHAALTQTKDYPSGTNWAVTDIRTDSAPQYLDREDSGQWLYGSSIRIKYYLGG